MYSSILSGGFISPLQRLVRRLFVPAMCLALAVGGCKATDSGGNTQPQPPEEPQVFSAATDASGLAEVQDEDGVALMRIQTTDESGNPLAGVDVIYLDSSPYPIVAFCRPETGEPAGTFLAVAGGSTAALSVSETDNGLDMGVFILNYLDPTTSHLYDPGTDPFHPVGQSNLEGIRRLVDLDALRMYLLTVPGLEGRVRYDLGFIRSQYPANTLMSLFDKFAGCVDTHEGCHLLLRAVTLAVRTAGQHDSFTYEIFADNELEHMFYAPMGVAADVNIDTPLDGVTITSETDRDIEVTGTINLPPDILTLDGGHVELWVNGIHYSNALGVGGDGTGTGSMFSSSTTFELAEGENTFRVVAYVSEVNRGLENGPAGEAGEATVTVNYQGGTSGPTAPSLSLVTYPTSLPCPQGASPVAFDFTDPDGDVVTAYQYMSWSIGGQTGDVTNVYDVYDQDRHACLRGTSAQCSFDLTYHGVNGGDWTRWEFWVEDAEGLSSNKISFMAVVTGDCLESSSSQPGSFRP